MRLSVTTLLLIVAITRTAAQGSQNQNIKLKTVLGLITTKAGDCILDKRKSMPDLVTVVAQISAGNINSSKGRCFPTCVMEKLGIMTGDNRTFSVDALKNQTDMIPHTKMKEIVLEQMTACIANATSEDGCEKGLQFVDCYVKAGILRFTETSDRLTRTSQKVLHSKRQSVSSGSQKLKQLFFFPPEPNSLASPGDLPYKRSRRESQSVQSVVKTPNLKRRQNSRMMGLDSSNFTLDVVPLKTNSSQVDTLVTRAPLINGSRPQVELLAMQEQDLVPPSTNGSRPQVPPVKQGDDVVLPANSSPRKLALEDFTNTSSDALPDIHYRGDTLHIPVNNVSRALPGKKYKPNIYSVPIEPPYNLSSFLPSVHNILKRPRVSNILTKSSQPKKPKAKVAGPASPTMNM